MIELSQYYLLLILFLFNGLWIIGFNAACEYSEKPNGEIEEKSKMIFWQLRYYAEKYFPYSFTKPMCNCIVCMPSIHGLWFWALYPSTGNLLTDLLTWVFYVMCLAGVMKIVSVKIDL